MGTLRLLLAILVALSHTGYAFEGHNQGVIAVVGFFLMSGYVMTALIEKYYRNARSFPAFALDRSLRLFPQYLFYLGATLCVASAWHIQAWNLHDYGVVDVILNVLMLPLALFMYLLPHSTVIPQSWTLGLEMTFYIVIPFILIYRVRAVAALLSAAFFLLPFFSVLDTDFFGYRLLPGTLFMFLCGSFIRTNNYRIVAAIWVYAAGLLALALARHALQQPYNVDVLTGLVIFIPIVAVLARMKMPRFDAVLGNASYGAYLNHHLLITILGIAHVNVFTTSGRIGLFILSAVLGWVTFRLIEHPVLLVRRRIRKAQIQSIPAVDVALRAR